MVDKYIQYFEDIASSHRLIGHCKSTTNNQGPVGEKRFTTWGAEEAVTGLKTSVGWPALLLEIFEVNTHSHSVHHVKGVYSGAFSVFDKVEFSNFEDQRARATECYEIVLDILRKIWQDHYGPDKDACSTPFGYVELNGLNIVYVAGLFDGSIHGWRCEFAFKPKNDINITLAPAEGIFI